jgi:hypothetical protein
LTELAKTGKLDPVIGREEGKLVPFGLFFPRLIVACRDSAYHPKYAFHGALQSVLVHRLTRFFASLVSEDKVEPGGPYL